MYLPFQVRTVEPLKRIGSNRRTIILMITQRKNIKTRSKRGKAGGVPLTVWTLSWKCRYCYCPNASQVDFVQHGFIFPLQSLLRSYGAIYICLALYIWQYLHRNVLFLGGYKQVNEDFFSLCNFSCLPWSTASRQKPHAFIPTFIELRYYQGCNWQRKSLISFEPNVTKQWRIL